MGSLLFKYLKDKATNDDTKDEWVYFDGQKKACSYQKLYEVVLKKIDYFKSLGWEKVYLLAMNDMETISSLIALLEIGVSPIIINGNQFANSEMYSNDWQKEIDSKYHIINDHFGTKFDLFELEKLVDDLDNITRFDKPGNNKIGIFTSGTLSSPKVIYTSEGTLINKVFESNYVNENRIMYNTAPLSTISGLFTNVFTPIISPNTKSIINNSFDPVFAILATDVYLPRNYSDTFKNTIAIKNKRIKRIFTYGEQNSNALFDFVRKKINGLPENVFINVYGLTECGGLISEIEEKNMQELHIYFLDIQNDTIIYSYNDRTFYKKVGNNITVLKRKEKKEYLKKTYTKYLPCGFINNKIHIKDNNCIGECLVNDYNTQDIITIVDGKFYVIGRKKYLDKNYYLANYDSELSSLTNRICATFTDKDNNLCVAVRCSIEDEDNVFRDHTAYFRRLVIEAPRIRKLIQEKYPNIKKTIFLPSNKFKLSGGIKKVKRDHLEMYLDYGRMIDDRIDNFEIYLRKNIHKCFLNTIGRIPRYKVLPDKNILISKQDVTLEQIVDVLDALGIVAIDEDQNYYKIIYNDSYFFNDDNDFFDNHLYSFYERWSHLYDDDTLELYKECAKYNLLIQRLAIDNKIITLNIDGHTLDLHGSMRDIYVYCIRGISSNGETIIIPYYAIDNEKLLKADYEDNLDFEKERLKNRQKVLEIIKNYLDYQFDEIEIIAPIPTSTISHDYDFLYDIIHVGEDGYTDLKSYIHQIIKNTYLYSLRNDCYLVIKNKQIIK